MGGNELMTRRDTRTATRSSIRGGGGEVILPTGGAATVANRRGQDLGGPAHCASLS